MNLKLNNKGLTLVEMIVSFALLGLFMVAAMRVVSYSINIYFAAKGVNNGVIVSNMVADKAGGIMSTMRAASEMNTKELGLDEDTTPFPCIKGGKLYFVDSTNCPVSMGMEDGALRITYFNKIETDPEHVVYKQVPWYFAKDAYMGYELKDFKIEKAGSAYPDNVYRLEFTVHSDRHGDFPTERFIKCYNLPE